MAFNYGNGCFAVAIFNALEPFKAIMEGSFEYVGICSKRLDLREIEFGLLYLLEINYLEHDTFTRNGDNLLNLYISPVRLDDTDFKDKLYSYIKLTGINDDVTATYLDNVIASCQPDNFGKITGVNMLNGLRQLDKPTVLILNLANIHFITAFYLPGNQYDLVIIDDGNLSFGNGIVHYLNYSYNIVGAIEVIDAELFNTRELDSMLSSIYSHSKGIQVQVHEIGWDNNNRELTLACRHIVKLNK